MRVTCPGCGETFDAQGERDTGTYCPACGHGFHY